MNETVKLGVIPPVELTLKRAGFNDDDGRFFEDTLICHRGCGGVFQIAFPSRDTTVELNKKDIEDACQEVSEE